MKNTQFRGEAAPLVESMPFPSVDAAAPQALLERCPHHRPTPLIARRFSNDGPQFYIKDERSRMGLGSFKALGAAYVIAHLAQSEDVTSRVFVAASAGNHGLSLAAGAAAFGARAIIYLSNTVPKAFGERLRDIGAEVVWAGDTYEASMQAAQDAAQKHGWTLLSDSSWDGYQELPYRVMEGYLVLAAEAVADMPEPPTDIFLQAGVGGLATSCAAYFRQAWGNTPKIHVVEPTAAPALQASIEAGKALCTEGPVSSMGRLDCKEPSLIALNGLARDADEFLLVSDAQVEELLPKLDAAGFATTPSGGAGLAAALLGLVPLSSDARVLCILSEGP